MLQPRLTSILLVLWLLVPSCLGELCYPPGGVAGIVIATFIVTVVVVGLVGTAAWYVWQRRKVKKRSSPAQKGIPGTFAYDNPYFRDHEDDTDSIKRKGNSTSNNKSSAKNSNMSMKNKKQKTNKAMHFNPGGKKLRTMDDSCLAVEPERTVVSLKGHDFTGLGFNICGNMRDGILVKDVLHRGPAIESGKIKAGDRILSVTVSFTNMVYEDALTILSYASPYDVQLELESPPEKSGDSEPSASGKRLGSSSFSSGGQRLFHPLYRSQSIDDLTQIGKDTFPGHGLGPRRSHSVGVAAHKLANHFRQSENVTEEKDNSTVVVNVNTTGSLNERMLASVMMDGRLKRGIPHWEKKFEDTLEVESLSSEKKDNHKMNERFTKPSERNLRSTNKLSLSSSEDEKSLPIRKCSDQSSSKPDISEKRKAPLPPSPVKIKAQIHHQRVDANGKMLRLPAEATNSLWHSDQSIRDDMTDFSDGLQTPIQRSSKADEETSDASVDSLEQVDYNTNKCKQPNLRSSSLGNLEDVENSSNSTIILGQKASSVDLDYDSSQPRIYSPHCQNDITSKISSEEKNKESKKLNKWEYRTSWSSLEKMRATDYIQEVPPRVSCSSSIMTVSENDAPPERTLSQVRASPRMSSKGVKGKMRSKHEKKETQSGGLNDGNRKGTKADSSIAEDSRIHSFDRCLDTNRYYNNRDNGLPTMPNIHFLPKYSSSPMPHQTDVSDANDSVTTTHRQYFIKQDSSIRGGYTNQGYSMPSHKSNTESWGVISEKRDSTKPVNGNAIYPSTGYHKLSRNSNDSSGRGNFKKDKAPRGSGYLFGTQEPNNSSKTVIISTFDNTSGRSSLRLSGTDLTN